MAKNFSHKYLGISVNALDPEYQANKGTFDFLEKRVAEIEAEHKGFFSCFSRGDSLMDETQTCEVIIK